jgi:hypothetical protein
MATTQTYPRTFAYVPQPASHVLQDATVELWDRVFPSSYDMGKGLKRFARTKYWISRGRHHAQDNLSWRMKLVAQEMHEAGMPLSAFLMLVADLDANARALYKQAECTPEAIQTASEMETGAQCEADIQQLRIAGELTCELAGHALNHILAHIGRLQNLAVLVAGYQQKGCK